MTCNTCGGWGNYPVAKHKGGPNHFVLVMEPCTDCFERGTCPECGEQDAFILGDPVADIFCGHCGWQPRREQWRLSVPLTP